RNEYALSKLEILNLANYTITTVDTFASSTEAPIGRGFHSMIRYGSIVILYGGKTAGGDNLNDMWKYIINSKTWVKVDEDKQKEGEFYLYKSGYTFTKINTNDYQERPIMIGGENRNREITDDIIFFDFPICQSDTQILGSTPCIP